MPPAPEPEEHLGDGGRLWSWRLPWQLLHNLRNKNNHDDDNDDVGVNDDDIEDGGVDDDDGDGGDGDGDDDEGSLEYNRML